jgi:hypothetical protein
MAMSDFMAHFGGMKDCKNHFKPQGQCVVCRNHENKSHFRFKSI